MDTTPYRHYLAHLEKQTGLTLGRKLLIFTAALILIAAGVVSTVFYKYQKEAPTRAEYQYLESTAADFESTSKSLEELLASFKVAGDKVIMIDTLRESTAAASGFFVALDDIERTLSKIEANKDNIFVKRSWFEQKFIPPKLSYLHNQILDFYNESYAVLLQLHSDHLFIKQLLLAAGPKFYLPVLTRDELWEKADKKQILNYYKDTKEQTNESLAALSKLSPPPRFKGYYDAQIAYMTILVNLSDNIINTLSVSDDPDIDSATQIEKSYQLLVGAKRENEVLSQQLLQEKLKVVDIGGNLDKLAPIEIRKNSIKESLSLAFAATPKMETFTSSFLRGLQIPSRIW